jgi:chromosome segregation ATPase
MYRNTNQILQAILQKNKNKEDIRILEIRLAKMKSDLNSLQDDLISLSQELPNSPEKINELKSQLATISLLIDKAQNIFFYLPTIWSCGPGAASSARLEF